MEDSPKIPAPKKDSQEKSSPSIDTSGNQIFFTPPPDGITPIPIQQKNILQLMQEGPDEEKPEYFQPNIIQRMQQLPEEERYEIFNPSLVQQLQEAQNQKSSERFALESSNKMPKEIQAKMENSFGTDFSNVNIHEGSNASNIGALAYTQGNDIHFAPGEFQPHTIKGQELLGHELTHVVQQREGKVEPSMQMKGININDSPALEEEADEMGKKAAQGKTVQKKPILNSPSSTVQFKVAQKKDGEEEENKTGSTFYFRVRISAKVDPEELIVIFLQQYKHVDEITARELKINEGWKWSGNGVEITQKDLENRYIDIRVTDSSVVTLSDSEKSESQKQFQGLSADEKDALNTEVDKQFWSNTQYKEGQKLDPSNPMDKIQAEYWKAIRAKLLNQKAQLDKLPSAIKEFLRSPESFKPENYEVLSRIADKLSQFDFGDFSDYKSKVNAETTDLLELEKSIERYLEEKRQRKQDQEEKEQIATKLYGLEELYQKYRTYKLLLTNSAVNASSMTPMGVGTSLGSQSTINKLREELDTNAKRHGFAGLADFELKINQYEEAFKKETIAIGIDALAKYEHILFEEEKKYKDLNYVRTIFQNLSPAKAHYETSESESLNASLALMSTRDHLTDDQLNRHMEHHQKSKEAKEQGDAIVSSQGSENSIFKESQFDKEDAASADNETDLQQKLLAYIQKKRSSIAETRENLKTTGLVFKLENLLETSFTQQGIEKGTIYRMIVEDKIREIKITEAIINLGIAIFSIALGLLTFGTGTVGVIAGAGAFGISAWQAYEEYKNYVELKDASAVGFTQDPSLIWVIIAIAGAGVDAASITASIKALAAPAKLFNETKDLAKLEKTLAQIGEVDAKIKQKVIESAKAQAQFDQALTDMTKASAKLYTSIIGDPEVYKEFVKAAYYAAKKGIIKFEQFMLELRLNKLIKEADQITPEELAKMKEAFEQGQKEFKENPKLYDDIVVPEPKSVEEITESLKSRIQAEPNRFELKLSDDEISRAIHEGRSKGLDDKTIEDIIFQGSRKEKGASIDEIIAQMNHTVAIKQQGYPVIFKSLDDFNKFKTEVITASLKKFGLPTDDIRIQGSLLRKTNVDEIGDIDIGIIVNQEDFNKWIKYFYDLSSMDKKRKALMKAKDSGIISANEMYFQNTGRGILGEVYEKFSEVFGVSSPKKIQISIILKDGKFDLSPYMQF